MEAIGIIGFIFGLAGLSYAKAAKEDITQLKKEFEVLRSSNKNN